MPRNSMLTFPLQEAYQQQKGWCTSRLTQDHVFLSLLILIITGGFVTVRIVIIIGKNPHVFVASCLLSVQALVWVDCEMTGLGSDGGPGDDSLLEAGRWSVGRNDFLTGFFWWEIGTGGMLRWYFFRDFFAGQNLWVFHEEWFFFNKKLWAKKAFNYTQYACLCFTSTVCNVCRNLVGASEFDHIGWGDDMSEWDTGIISC